MWKNVLTYGVTFLAGLIAGGTLMQRAIKKQMSQAFGNMDPNMMNALTQQMGGMPQAGGANPLAGKVDPKSLEAINQQIANMDPATLNALNQQLAGMDPATLNAMAQQMGIPIPPGQNLNVVSSPTNNIPITQQTSFPVVNRTAIKPLNLTASQLGTGGNLRV
ncbi:MAG: hypothetical protein AB1782_13345 [Cyanobacteriota bacterium]